MALVARPIGDACRHSMAGLKPHHANGKREAPSPLPRAVSCIFCWALLPHLLRHAMMSLLMTSHKARAFMPSILWIRSTRAGHFPRVTVGKAAPGPPNQTKPSQSPTSRHLPNATSRNSFCFHQMMTNDPKSHTLTPSPLASLCGPDPRRQCWRRCECIHHSPFTIHHSLLTPSTSILQS